MAADTIVPDMYFSQALNRYMYVVGNPVKYFDPTGHSPDPGAGYSKTGRAIYSAERRFRDISKRIVIGVFPKLFEATTTITGEKMTKRGPYLTFNLKIKTINQSLIDDYGFKPEYNFKLVGLKSGFNKNRDGIRNRNRYYLIGELNKQKGIQNIWMGSFAWELGKTGVLSTSMDHAVMRTLGCRHPIKTHLDMAVRGRDEYSKSLNSLYMKIRGVVKIINPNWRKPKVGKLMQLRGMGWYYTFPIGVIKWK